MKRIIKDYLYFSKRERIAVLVLLVLMASFIALPYLYSPKAAPPVINEALADWLSGNADSSTSVKEMDPPASTSTVVAVLFPFDPNTASENDWMRLGLPAKLIRTIGNYRSKGGRFRQPDDLRKIWGMSRTDADRLVPYVRIAATIKPVPLNHPDAGRKKTEPIDINAAGLMEWASLPGIGDVLASRILRYREKLGGFRSLQQVGKTYGISDSLFAVILPYLQYNEHSLPRLNLNTASVYALRQTGMDYRLASSLVRYREQNGPYKSMETLHQLLELPDTAWQKLMLVIKIE